MNKKLQVRKSDLFDGFTVRLFRDDEKDWIGTLEEMPNVSAFADSPDTALSELAVAWRGVKASYRKHGERIPVAPRRRR